MGKIISVQVVPDDYTAKVSQAFDYTFSGKSEFVTWDVPGIPEDYSIGLIVGASGSGKSLLLKEFGEETHPGWYPNKAIVSHFSTPEDAVNRLLGVGLSSIPVWVKPYHVLSTGEKFRADMARRLDDGAVVDEFTSVVDRNVAKSTCAAINRMIHQRNWKNIVFASCHFDIVPWLCPDWVFDTNTGQITTGRYLRRPQIQLDIYPADKELWGLFGKHHYLNNALNKAARCYVGVAHIDDEECLVCWAAILPMPSGTVKNAWREHRVVVLPDFQGLGLGVRFSDAIGQMFIDESKRYFSRTSHPKMGAYRGNSKLWRATSSNNKKTNPNGGLLKGWHDMTQGHNRVGFSHEYIGRKDGKEAITAS